MAVASPPVSPIGDHQIPSDLIIWDPRSIQVQSHPQGSESVRVGEAGRSVVSLCPSQPGGWDPGEDSASQHTHTYHCVIARFACVRVLWVVVVVLHGFGGEACTLRQVKWLAGSKDGCRADQKQTSGPICNRIPELWCFSQGLANPGRTPGLFVVFSCAASRLWLGTVIFSRDFALRELIIRKKV